MAIKGDPGFALFTWWCPNTQEVAGLSSARGTLGLCDDLYLLQQRGEDPQVRAGHKMDIPFLQRSFAGGAVVEQLCEG